MLTEVRAGALTVRGVSLAGVYTSLQVPELDVVLDAGMPMRSFASTDRLFLSHMHGDHASAVLALLGIRELIGKRKLRIFLPQQAEADLRALIDLGARTHHARMDAELIPMSAGEVHPLGRGLEVRAFATHHSVPSL